MVAFARNVERPRPASPPPDVVVLDTTVPGYSHGELTDDQLDRLAAELAEPAPDGTVLALHHPPLPTPSRIAAAIDLRDRKRLAPSCPERTCASCSPGTPTW